jgi:hypothetical protein
LLAKPLQKIEPRTTGLLHFEEDADGNMAAKLRQQRSSIGETDYLIPGSGERARERLARYGVVIDDKDRTPGSRIPRHRHNLSNRFSNAEPPLARG